MFSKRWCFRNAPLFFRTHLQNTWVFFCVGLSCSYVFSLVWCGNWSNRRIYLDHGKLFHLPTFYKRLVQIYTLHKRFVQFSAFYKRLVQPFKFYKRRVQFSTLYKRLAQSLCSVRGCLGSGCFWGSNQVKEIHFVGLLYLFPLSRHVPKT